MKRNVNKAANEFEKLLNEEFQNKSDSKGKSQENNESHDRKDGKDDAKSDCPKSDETTKKERTGDDKK